jgi:hypothetical protein
MNKAEVVFITLPPNTEKPALIYRIQKAGIILSIGQQTYVYFAINCSVIITKFPVSVA